MNIQISDRVLWVGLGTFFTDLNLFALDTDFTGVSLFLAVRSICDVLHQVRELTQIKHDEKEDHVIGEGTEEGRYMAVFKI